MLTALQALLTVSYGIIKMNHLRPSIATLILASTCLATLIGCGPGKPADRTEELKTFGLVYANYATAMGKTATSWDDLLNMADEMGLTGEKDALQSMKESGYVFRGDATLDGKAAADVALLYHPDALANGGEAFFADGSVGPVTSEELKKAIE